MSGAKKKVPVTIMIRTWVEVPDDWTDHDTQFFYNGSSHCIGNEIRDIADNEPDNGCTVCWRTDTVLGHYDAEDLEGVAHRPAAMREMPDEDDN